MERHLGRLLNSYEIVHHIDENPFNNDLSNLQLVNRSEHKKLHPNIGVSTQLKKVWHLDVQEILALHKEYTCKAIAEYFGCSGPTIERIIRAHLSRSETRKFGGKKVKIMKTKLNQAQQGDVCLRRINKIPEGAVKQKSDARGIVLAEGEVTGHFHGIEECEDAELYQLGERMLLSVKAPVELTHQEHGKITIEPGVWEVEQLREKDWLSGLERKVTD